MLVVAALPDGPAALPWRGEALPGLKVRTAAAGELRGRVSTKVFLSVLGGRKQ